MDDVRLCGLVLEKLVMSLTCYSSSGYCQCSRDLGGYCLHYDN